ncbi:MAG TPA: hypothetical protein VIU93_04765 [Gallionellaceae bacterium]
MLENIRFARVLKYFLVVILTLSTSGCLLYWTKTGDAEEPVDNSILAYGYFDDSEAPFNFRWGQLRQMLPRTDEPFHDVKLNKKGLFYLENLPVGSYTIESLGGPVGGLSSAYWRWHFPDTSTHPEFKLTELRAGKPGIYFMGAYKVYESKKGGLFSVSEYASAPVSKPSELEILQQLHEKTQNTKWDRLVMARIAELKKSK